MAIVLGTLYGAYYRALASAIFAASAVCGFFLVALLGPPLTELLGGAVSAPEYLLRLMQDADLRNRMGEAGRRRAVEHYDYRHIARRFCEFVSQRLGIE